MKVRHAWGKSEKIELKMTAMIDIVFLLLIFFIMTFQIVAPEGDFNVHVPIVAKEARDTDMPPRCIPPIKIRLTATETGHLAGIHMGGRNLGRNFKALNMELRQIVGDGTGASYLSDVEVEIDSDYALRYEYVMDAISAVSGYVGPDDNVVRVCEKIRFAPPRTGE